MPQAMPAVKAAWAYLGSNAFFAGVVKTILINVALGALTFTDEDGNEWSAV